MQANRSWVVLVAHLVILSCVVIFVRNLLRGPFCASLGPKQPSIQVDSLK
jgi:hypothetical protein